MNANAIYAVCLKNFRFLFAEKNYLSFFKFILPHILCGF